MRQKQLKQQELDRLNHHLQQQNQHQQPMLRQHSVPAPIFSNCSSLQVLSNHSPHRTSPSPPVPGRPPPQYPPGITFTSQQAVTGGQHPSLPSPSSSSSSHHPHSVPASPLSHVKQLHQGVQVPVASIGNMSSSVPSGNFMALCATTSSNSNIPGSAVMTLTNGGSHSDTSSASYSVDQGGSVPNGPAETLRLKPINTKEFEDVVGSSPFDDALLRSIDDKQELNSVFANVHPPPNNNPSNNFNGPNHSAYNNFNPR